MNQELNVRSNAQHQEDELIELHSFLTKSLNMRVNYPSSLLYTGRQRQVMVVWKERLDQYILTNDVTLVTNHVPKHIGAAWFIRQTVLRTR